MVPTTRNPTAPPTPVLRQWQWIVLEIYPELRQMKPNNNVDKTKTNIKYTKELCVFMEIEQTTHTWTFQIC